MASKRRLRLFRMGRGVVTRSVGSCRARLRTSFGGVRRKSVLAKAIVDMSRGRIIMSLGCCTRNVVPTRSCDERPKFSLGRRIGIKSRISTAIIDGSSKGKGVLLSEARTTSILT